MSEIQGVGPLPTGQMPALVATGIPILKMPLTERAPLRCRMLACLVHVTLTQSQKRVGFLSKLKSGCLFQQNLERGKRQCTKELGVSES